MIFWDKLLKESGLSQHHKLRGRWCPQDFVGASWGMATKFRGGLRNFVGRQSQLLRALDAKFFHPAAQCVGMQVQHLRRAAFALDYPLRLRKHIENMLPLDVFQRTT